MVLTQRQRTGLLDYLFNGYEHADCREDGIADLVKYGLDADFASAVLEVWDTDPRRFAARGCMAQQAVAETLVDEVLTRFFGQALGELFAEGVLSATPDGKVKLTNGQNK